MKFDLHIHSNYSDGRASVVEIINAAVRRGLDGIALTDHDNMRGIPAARRYIKEQKLDLILIPGVEVTTSEGHLLVLGVEEPPKRKLTPRRPSRRLTRWAELPMFLIRTIPFGTPSAGFRMWTPWRSITQSISLVSPMAGPGSRPGDATCPWWPGATRILPRLWAWE